MTRICEHADCNEYANFGFKGRIAVYEVIEVSEIIQGMMIKKGNEAEIENQAKKEGMITMRQDGILKVLKGITTISEIERVTKGSLSIGGEVDDA